MSVDARIVEAFREQLRRRADAWRVGWKLGIGERERLGGIAVGNLTTATLLAPGSVYGSHGAQLHADAEIAVRIGPGGEIDAYAPALELVDLSGPQHDPFWAIVENVFHRAVAFGPWTGDLPASLDGTLLVNGEARRSKAASADLEERVDDARRVLEMAGERFEPGDQLITGNVVQVPVVAGDTVEADLGALGSVSVEIG